MLRHFPAAVLLLAAVIAPQAVQARDYQDPAGRFTMTVPDGWETSKPSDASTLTILLAKQKTDASPYDGVCLGIYVELAETKSKTQAEINSLIDGNLTPEFWNEALKGTGGNDLKVTASSNREKDGRKINSVVFSGTKMEDGDAKPATGKMELHFIPGSMHSLMCMTESASWELASAPLDRMFNSYEPRTPALIASLAPGGRSVLTMFAGRNHDGVARVLSQDTPNLPAAGWVPLAGSLQVDGTGAWQVCDRVNYAGACRTINGRQSAPGNSLLAVNSARRLLETQGISSAAGSAFRRALAELGRQGRSH